MSRKAIVSPRNPACISVRRTWLVPERPVVVEDGAELEALKLKHLVDVLASDLSEAASDEDFKMLYGAELIRLNLENPKDKKKRIAKIVKDFKDRLASDSAEDIERQARQTQKAENEKKAAIKLKKDIAELEAEKAN